MFQSEAAVVRFRHVRLDPRFGAEKRFHYLARDVAPWADSTGGERSSMLGEHIYIYVCVYFFVLCPVKDKDDNRTNTLVVHVSTCGVAGHWKIDELGTQLYRSPLVAFGDLKMAGAGCGGDRFQ